MPASSERFRPAIVDDIEHHQLQADFARDMPGSIERVDSKIGAQSTSLPAFVHGDHREIQGWDRAGIRRSRRAVRTEFVYRNGMGVQGVVAENPWRPFGDRDEYPREIVYLPLLRTETQKDVEAVRSTGKRRPIMAIRVERFDSYAGADGIQPASVIRDR